MALNIWVLLACLGLTSPVWSQSVDGSKFNNPTAGPPASYFAAATTVPIAALQSAAAKASVAAKDATYPINSDNGAKRVTIHKDWTNFSEGAAFVWVADMDVDCDGIDYKCKGNPDGQSETNFGALAAYEVPFIVIPDTFGTTYQSDLSGNNVAAVICDNRMFYGIYGDSDGDDPEVIGEASWLMARTCFPAVMGMPMLPHLTLHGRQAHHRTFEKFGSKSGWFQQHHYKYEHYDLSGTRAHWLMFMAWSLRG
ncbi:unnamed protein product [Penicillium pancosmium]